MGIDNSQVYEIYKNRLLDMSGRNKLISFKLTTKGVDLFDFYDFNILDILNGQTIHINQKAYLERLRQRKSYVSQYELDEYEDDFSGYLKKLEKLRKDNDAHYRESGKRSLYMSYYFLAGKLHGDNTIKVFAPLFLIPIEIETTMSSFKLKKADEDIVVNRTILIAFMKTLKGKIDLNSYELNEVNEKVLLDLIGKIEELGIDIKRNLDFSKFPSKPLEVVTDKFNVYNHLVLSNIDVSNVLFDDYEKIGNDSNESIRNLLNDNVVLNRDSDRIQAEYNNIDLTNRELALISKLDTSQELAVYMAKKSNNLVIYGPPGTGKSETILNIISDNVNSGKRMLVVSEKKAAVNVLYNRLMELQKVAIMLDSSNIQLNTLKQEMAEKLESIYVNPEKFNLETSLDKIEECYNHFNGIYDILNTEYNGRKIADWYSEKKIEDSDLNFDIDIERIEYLVSRNKEIRELFNIEYSKFMELLEKVEDAELVKTYKSVILTEEKLDFVKSLFEYNIVAKDLIFELYDVRDREEVFRQKFDEMAQVKTRENDLINEKRELPNLENKKKDATHLRDEIDKFDDLLSHKTELIGFYDTLCSYVNNVNNENDVSNLINYGRNSCFRSNHLMLEYLNQIVHSYNSYFELNSNLFKKMFNGSKSQEVLNDIQSKKQSFMFEYNTIRTGLNSEVQEINEKKTKTQSAYENCNKEISEIVTKLNDIEEKLNVVNTEKESLRLWVKKEFANLPNLSKISKNGANLVVYLKDINSFIEVVKSFREDRERLKDLVVINNGLLGLYHFLYKENILGVRGSKELLWKIYLELHIEKIGIQYEDELQNIRTYEEVQNKYSDFEGSYFRNTRKNILSKVIDKRNYWNKPDEYAIKERNFKKDLTLKKRNIKLRQFMSLYFEVIQDYFPIILATPEAVSKYLPLIKDTFDIIIFDEASQLVIENALPSIYRGQKIIVVGDDKQLKPSAFFKASMDIEEEIGMTSEEKLSVDDMLFLPDSLTLLSLLDITKGKYNSVSLLFHYRSKFAELIDFSNAVFYKGQLKLAPNVLRNSVNDSITRIKVNGSWYNQTNEEEAEKVVSLLKKIFRERKENETIGIITFNAKQKTCIEEAIDREVDSNSSFRTEYLKESNRISDFEDKSIFVKNIENVQGDERDIIIFSVGYAYDSRGKLPAAFGPLSQEGGENRLNVAVSRAKKKVYLVTSFEPEELNVDNTKHEGAKIFKDYLLYAKYISDKSSVDANTLLNKYRGAEMIENQSFDSPFEEQVYKALTDLGYTVDTQIGCYGFRIDMAIYDENKGKYVLGIECDGATYHSSKKAKDRDIARQAFLESRGWKIHRIWSTSWWKEQKYVLEKLQAVIEENLK